MALARTKNCSASRANPCAMRWCCHQFGFAESKFARRGTVAGPIRARPTHRCDACERPHRLLSHRVDPQVPMETWRHGARADRGGKVRISACRKRARVHPSRARRATSGCIAKRVLALVARAGARGAAAVRGAGHRVRAVIRSDVVFSLARSMTDAIRWERPAQHGAAGRRGGVRRT